ncbi:hypothetical protein EDC04DRAFT_2956640 [Pisolithus marmoratus]|nr:hypothetical protein EDC04DRAFT_2956640 [Pisolithus marmoratus]
MVVFGFGESEIARIAMYSLFKVLLSQHSTVVVNISHPSTIVASVLDTDHNFDEIHSLTGIITCWLYSPCTVHNSWVCYAVPLLGMWPLGRLDLRLNIDILQTPLVILRVSTISYSTPFTGRFYFISMHTKANQTLLCPTANCRKADGSARAANGKCKWQPPHCAQCCKLGGGCGLPGHQPKGALPLPSPSPVVPLCEASRTSPVIDPTLMAVSTEVHPQSSTLLTVGPSLSEPFSLTPHSLSLSPSSTLIPSASHTGPTTCLYACPLDENYAWAYYEAHAKTFEVEQLLKQSAQVQSDLQSIIHVVVWVRAQEAPRHIRVVNPTPGTFVPAAHQIITDPLTADKVSVYCQDLWFEQLLTAPLVVPKTDATVLCMTMLSVLGTAEEIEKKFPLAFPNTDSVLSTFYKHRKPFMDASTLGLVESRVALGHTEGGKWALLKADVERFMKEGSLNMGSSVNTLSLPSTFNPSLLPQDSNQQDASYSLNTETTVAPELLGEIGNDMDMAFSFTDFDLSFVLNDLQSDNTLLNLEESQHNSVFDDLLQDNAS